MSEQTRLSDGDLREFRERLEEDRRAGLALWRVSTHMSPIDVIDETLARGVEREEAEAGWAAAREYLRLWFDEDAVPAEDEEGLRAEILRFLSSPLPSHTVRIKAMEKVVELLRRMPKKGLEAAAVTWLEERAKVLSDLDAIEKRIGGKE